MLRIKWIGPARFALLLGVMLTALWSGSPAQAAGPICYVDKTATGAANGLSWTDAYTTVQDALADGGCTEIWVAEGVYYPDEGAGQTDNARASTFQLKNGVSLYGAFAGEVGNKSANAKANQESTGLTLLTLQSQRAAESGVNPDEELLILNQLQVAYDSAAKFLQTLRDLDDTLLQL